MRHFILAICFYIFGFVITGNAQQAPPEQMAPQQVTPPPAEPKLTITAAEATAIKQPVTFGTLGKTSLPESLIPHLDSVAAILQKYPDLYVLIVGHTCNIGSEKENMKVGEERAKSVATYLQGKGVVPERMAIRPAGESEPMGPNSSKLNRWKNRRVIIEIL